MQGEQEEARACAWPLREGGGDALCLYSLPHYTHEEVSTSPMSKSLVVLLQKGLVTICEHTNNIQIFHMTHVATAIFTHTLGGRLEGSLHLGINSKCRESSDPHPL